MPGVGEKYPEAVLAKYRAIVQGMADPSRTPNERRIASDIQAKMQLKYPGIDEQAREREGGGGFRSGTGGMGGGAPFSGAPFTTSPPFGYKDWGALFGDAALSFAEFLRKMNDDLDKATSAQDVRAIVEQVEFKRMTKSGKVCLRFDFNGADVADMIETDESFNTSAEHFGKIAEAAFRHSFGK